MNLFTFNFKSRMLTVLLLSVLALPLPEFFLPSTMTYDEIERIDRERFWAVKTHRNDLYDMVLLGDSRTYRGVSPQAMQELLPQLRILNFGYSSLGLTTELVDEAIKKIDTASAKKILVIGVTPYSLTKKAAMNEHFLQEKNRKREDLWQRRYINPLYLKWQQWMHPEISAQKSPAINGTPIYHQEFYDNGWVGSRTEPENTKIALKIYREEFKNNQVEPGTINQLAHKTKELVGQGIEVFAYRVPCAIELKQLEDEVSGFAEESFIKQFIEAGGKWITLPDQSFHSYDGSHLTKESAIEMSKLLAKKILAN